MNSNYHNLLVPLIKDCDSVPYKDRLDLIKSISKDVTSKTVRDKDIIDIIHILAKDKRSDIREVTASCIHILPEESYNEVSAILSHDNSTYVRKAASMSAEKRIKNQKVKEKQEEKLDKAEEIRKKIVEKFGASAGRMATAMAEEVVNSIVGSTAHEFRRVMSPIITKSDKLNKLLEKGNIDEKVLKKDLSIMSKRSTVLGTLIDSLRNFTKPTPASFHKILLSDIVKEAMSSAVDFFNCNDIDISDVKVGIKIYDEMIVNANKIDLGLVFENIIKNAIESHEVSLNTFKEDSEVIIEIKKEKEIAKVSISDKGIGFSKEELARLKEFKHRGSSKEYGVGFGIPTARRLVLQHKGKFQVMSKHRHGSTFTISLPIAI